MKTKKFAKVIFDRRGTVKKTGMGNVEIYIYLGGGEKKYINFRRCNAIEWRTFQKSEELKEEVAIYEHIIERMVKNCEEMTIENLDLHLGGQPKTRVDNRRKKLLASPMGFIEFMEEEIKKENIKAGTLARRRVTIEAMHRYGKLNRFQDCTDLNVRGFDDFLLAEGGRERVSIHNYHKTLKKYCRLAFQMGYLDSNPYDSPLCHFDRGQCRERQPLSEEELLYLRNIALPPKEARVRDLFVFCAYTGLAYADSQAFDYFTMTEKAYGNIYIDGRRIKTGSNFFTPILPPAIEILERYSYQLPHISNQKANDFLHLIEDRCNFNKPLTMHVARHSFATLLLNYDIPIENVARMMGHKNIKTTQIYARILKSTIERHTESLVTRLR